MPAVALDVMSGDAGLGVAIAAARRAAAANADWDILLVGDEGRIREELARTGNDAARWQVRHAGEVVEMTDTPARAVRRRDTSMRRALELVGEGQAGAAVSAGNTGALMGLGVLVLRVIDGISRPAIASFIPNRKPAASCCMLDLGANVKCTAQMLCDFALMGSALSRAVKKKNAPRVGLLNIGTEAHKGSEVLKQAAEMLEEDARIEFAGYVEGFSMYSDGSGKDSVDVVVCDGFSGNVALKASEGLAKMISGMIHDALRASVLSRLCALLAYPLLARLRRDFDHRQYNGAMLLGLRGVVVKSHGNADEVGLAAAIQTAIEVARQDLPTIIAGNIASASGAGAADADAAGAAEGGDAGDAGDGADEVAPLSAPAV